MLRQRKVEADDGKVATLTDGERKSTQPPKQKTSRSYLGCCCRWLGIVLLLCTVGAVVLKLFFEQEMILFLMRFFRDVSRAKAHRRLHGDNNALMTMLTGSETLLPLKDPEDDGMYMTPEELKQFTGSDGTPLYLAIMGRVYDVSKGKSFYGIGRSYHHYVGIDASRSFATGCTKEECLVSSMVGLSPDQKQEAMRWLELYEHHDKYKFIGTLRNSPVDDLVAQEEIDLQVLEESQKLEVEFGTSGDVDRIQAAKQLSSKAKGKYMAGRFDEAGSFWKSALLQLGEASSTNEAETFKERADILVTMGAMAQKRRLYEEANENYQEAQDGLIEVLGLKDAMANPTYARSVSDQAAAFYMLKKHDDAIQGFKRALECYKEAITATEALIELESSVTDANEDLTQQRQQQQQQQQHNGEVVQDANLKPEKSKKSELGSLLAEQANSKYNLVSVMLGKDDLSDDEMVVVNQNLDELIAINVDESIDSPNIARIIQAAVQTKEDLTNSHTETDDITTEP